jgi:hypothetical protein
MKIWYKIVERKNNRLYSLFHGNNGTRVIPLGQWVQADVKKVHDGTNGTPYTSGWHIIATVGEARRYLRKFSADRTLTIVPCRARGVSPKHHSRYDVHLAKALFIHEEVV